MKTKILLLGIIGLTSILGSNPSFANPDGGTVVGGSGNATITGQGTSVTTIIQTANQAIINWQSFSIAAGEVTRFVQPSATSSTLNRVISGNPSLIYGTLQANGRVFVINPNGILVGQSGKIDTKGFVASTFNVSDAAFLGGGNLTFSGNSTAAINNQGTIQALGGDIFIIAHTVENKGIIAAPQGTVGLAAGSTVQLIQSGDERLSVTAGDSSSPAAVGVNNLGTVQAASAELKAAGGNIYALAINNGGVVRATGVANVNGHIYLSAAGGNIQNSGVLSAQNADGSGGQIIVDGGHNATTPSTVINSGTISASGTAPGAAGGIVEVLGDAVGLLGDSLVNVSGDAGGGTALIGGDFHGANAAVENAEVTYVSADATIKANAGTSGSGGDVVVWAQNHTVFDGSISAAGGSQSGSGGAVEVSGKNVLGFAGTVDLSAKHGSSGNLLLDPATFTVNPTGPPDLNGDGTVGDDIATLNDLATPGSISTTANSIITSGAVSALLSGNVTLTLAATTSGTINGNITGTGGANLVLNAPALTLAGTISLGGGGVLSGTATMVHVMNGGSIQNGVNVAASGATVTIDSGMYSDDVNVQQSTLTLSVPTGTATANSWTSGATTTLTLGGNFASAAGMTFNGPVMLSAATSLSDTGGNNIAFQSSLDGATTLQVTTAGNAVFGGVTGANANLTGLTVTADEIDLGASTIAGAVNLTTSSLVKETGLLTVTGLTTVTAAAANSDVSLRSFANNFHGVNLAKTGLGSFHDIALWDASATPVFVTGLPASLDSLTLEYDHSGVSLPALMLTGNLQVTAAGLVDFAGATPTTIGGTLGITTSAGGITASGGSTLAVTGVSTLAAGAANNITLNNTGNDFSTVTITSGDIVSLADANGIILGASTVSGTLGVTAGGSISQSGVLSVANGLSTFTVTGASSDVLLGSFANTFDGVQLAATGAGTFHDVALWDASMTPTFATGLPASLNNLSLEYDHSGVTLGATTLTGTLNVTAGGAITQTGILNVSTGLSTFRESAASSDLLLGSFANVFDGVQLATSGAGSYHNVALWDASATPVFVTGLPASLNNLNLEYDHSGVTLPGMTVAGTLNVMAAGSISQSGLLSVANGVSTFTVTAANSDVLVGSFANIFDGVQLATFGAGTFRNVAIWDASTTPTFVAGLPTSLNNLTLEYDHSGVSLPALMLTGNLQVTAAGLVDFAGPTPTTIGGTLGITTSAGGITASGGSTLKVMDASTLAAGAGNNITLNNMGNDFSIVSITSGNNVSLADANAILLAASTVSGTFGVTAGGSISQGGLLNVAGGLSTFTESATGSDLMLGSFANVFDGVHLATMGAGSYHNISLRDASATPTFVTGLPSALNNLSLDYDHSGVTLPAMTLMGTLSVTAGGTISESGLLTVANGLSAFTESAASSDLLLGSFANVFDGVNLATTGAGSFRNIALWDASATPIFVTGLPVSLNNLTLEYDHSGVTLPGMTVAGTLNVTAGGTISEGGLLNVASGLSTFTESAANSDLLLGSFANVFDGVHLAMTGTGSYRNISLWDASATPTFVTGLPGSFNNLSLEYDHSGVTLPGMTLAGTLNVTAGGTIAESGLLNVANGLSTFTESAANSDLLLGSFANVFDGVHLATTGAGSFRNIALWDASTTPVFVTGLPASLNNLSLEYDHSGVTLPGTTVAGTLTVTAGGPISESGLLNVANGLSTFTAGAANNITLNNAGNDFSTVAIGSGNNVSLRDANGIILGPSTVSGTLGVTAGGQISENGALAVTGTSTFTETAANSDVLLGGFANMFGGVQFATTGAGSFHNIALQDAAASGIELPTLSLTGELDINAGGPVTESGTITANSLSITTPGQVTLTGGNSVGMLAANVTGANQSFTFYNQGTVQITTVAGISGMNTVTGITTDNGNVTIKVATGNIDENSPISAGTGNVSLLGQVNIGLGFITEQLAGLSTVVSPEPKSAITSYGGSSMGGADAEKILPVNSIGVLFLEVPFVQSGGAEDYKIEDNSKWTSGRIAAAGTTAGPQGPR